MVDPQSNRGGPRLARPLTTKLPREPGNSAQARRGYLRALAGLRPAAVILTGGGCLTGDPAPALVSVRTFPLLDATGGTP
jgi:hypothetical protein